MHGELLEDLARQFGCHISALRTEEYREDIGMILETFPFEEYTLEECAYSLSYIYGASVQFTDYEQIRRFAMDKEKERTA